VIVTGDPNVLVSVIYRGQNLSKALRDGLLRLEGDERKLRAFFSAFKAPSASTPTTTSHRRGQTAGSGTPSGTRAKRARRQV
jgi:hypothetical protein